MERKECEECGGKLVKKKVEFKMYGISLGEFSAEVCTKCDEEVFDEKTSKEIDAMAKKKGLLYSTTKKVKIGDVLSD